MIKTGALGDLIAGSTAIRALRENFPESRITFLSRNNALSICPPNSIIDEFIDYTEVIATKGYIGLLKLIRKRKFDVAINLKWTSEISALLTILSGANETAGSGPRFFKLLYKYRPPVYEDDKQNNRHEYLKNLDIVEAIGIPKQEPNAYVHHSNKDEKFAANFFTQNDILPEKTLMITPGASHMGKAWKMERYIEVGKKFLAEFEGKIIISWVPGYETVADKMVREIGPDAIKTPKTTVGQVTAITKSIRLLLCNNSGILHIAYAVNTPVVCMNTSIGWRPYGKTDTSLDSFLEGDPSKNRYTTDEESARLLEKITVDQVWKAVKKKWKELNKTVYILLIVATMNRYLKSIDFNFYYFPNFNL